MAEEIKARFKTVVKNVMPAVVVMFTGLVGTYLVYNNYLSDRVSASQVNNLEPAAGGDETATAAPSSEEKIAPAAAPSGATPAATGGAAPAKVYNDEGEDSGNGPDTSATPSSGTTTPPADSNGTATPPAGAAQPATTPPATH